MNIIYVAILIINICKLVVTILVCRNIKQSNEIRINGDDIEKAIKHSIHSSIRDTVEQSQE